MIEGLDEDISQELKNRAVNYLENRDQRLIDQCHEMGMSEDLTDSKELVPEMLFKLVTKKIKTKDDLAELSGDELLDIIGSDALSIEIANKIIMAAREHWFTNDASSDGAA